ncbi:MAG: hypothetical protein KAH12_00250 [Anaerolineales bacterium]|nr:hypothetical protein [Anaerolineales bacterium]
MKTKLLLLLTGLAIVQIVFGAAERIKTYPKITTTYGGVFENVDVLRVDVSSIYCKSQIGYHNIPLAHLPSEVLTDLNSYISQAKALAFQKAEDQRKRIEAERQRIEIEREQIRAELKREEAERLRIYNEEQSRKQRGEQQEQLRVNVESQIHEEEKKASRPSADPYEGGAIHISPFIKHILIIIISGTILAGLFGRKKHHKISA